MRKSILLSFFIFIAFLGCGEKPENIVKNGTLDFNQNITIGEAFNKYKYFKSTKWSSTVDSNNNKIVEFIGTIDFEKLRHRAAEDLKMSQDEIEKRKKEFKKKFGNAKMSYIAQFVIKDDDQGKPFEIKYGALKFYIPKKDVQEETPDKEFTFLKEIVYKNRPSVMVSAQ